jgi:hypothetical protein
MSTNAEALLHLISLRDAVDTAINSVNYYKSSSTDMTASARNTTLARVTTIPSALQHANDCGICTGWDGS